MIRIVIELSPNPMYTPSVAIEDALVLNLGWNASGSRLKQSGKQALRRRIMITLGTSIETKSVA